MLFYHLKIKITNKNKLTLGVIALILNLNIYAPPKSTKGANSHKNGTSRRFTSEDWEAVEQTIRENAEAEAKAEAEEATDNKKSKNFTKEEKEARAAEIKAGKELYSDYLAMKTSTRSINPKALSSNRLYLHCIALLFGYMIEENGAAARWYNISLNQSELIIKKMGKTSNG